MIKFHFGKPSKKSIIQFGDGRSAYRGVWQEHYIEHNISGMYGVSFGNSAFLGIIKTNNRKDVSKQERQPDVREKP